jgi:two-component system CheB/CheR fusion protein
VTFEAGRGFESLVEYLRDTRGFDFTGYKRPSLMRRVSRRASDLGMQDFTAYLDYLQVHAEEFAILFDKILINVTEFFRDKAAWDYLARNIVPKLIAKDGEIRVWSTGTASGEEAYSAAILLCEALGEESFIRRVKIYATDIDEDALSRARGAYTEKDLESLGPEMRARYFEAQGQEYVFQTPLRRTVIFGRHDLMRDAPISRLDLLICRNTLIYFTAEAQGRILARFHSALNDDGYLFLGRSELLLTHAELFTPVDITERIFSKVAQTPLRDRVAVTGEAGKGAVDQLIRRQRVRELATEGTPHPQLIVDAEGILVSANQAARRLFEVKPEHIGRVLKDLELSYKPIDLRTPIDRVRGERRAVVTADVELRQPDGRAARFEINAMPLIDDDGSLVGTALNFVDGTQAMAMRAEFERVKEELQEHEEELTTTNEELQSTVEELETTNAELQSANEELETLNEELESTNAELETITTDLRRNGVEVERLNTLLLAITGNIELGAVVLDRDSRVQVWNERASDLWGLSSQEVLGKALYDLDMGLPADQLKSLIGAGTVGQRLHDELVVTARTRRGRSIRCRVMAHAFGNGERPAGVVLVMEELGTPKPG